MKRYLLASLVMFAALSGCRKGKNGTCDWRNMETELAPFASLVPDSKNCSASLEHDHYDLSLTPAERSAECRSTTQRGCSATLSLRYNNADRQALLARMQGVFTRAGYAPEPAPDGRAPLYRSGNTVLEYSAQSVLNVVLVHITLRNRPPRAVPQ